VCARICMGCCDSAGKCVGGNNVNACGASGAACEDCSKNTCLLTEAPCCKPSGGCGCAVGGLVGCM
jgi:hypothetical protein